MMGVSDVKAPRCYICLLLQMFQSWKTLTDSSMKQLTTLGNVSEFFVCFVNVSLSLERFIYARLY